jgi:predicted enzyme related to lactoylglutathione lyase
VPQAEQTPAASAPEVIWFELYADDVDRACQFYQRVFGWTTRPFLDYDPTGGYLLLSYVPDGRTKGAIVRRQIPADGATAPRGCIVYVEVPELAGIVAAVEEAGGRLIEDTRSIGADAGRFCLVADTEGNLIGLWAER